MADTRIGWFGYSIRFFVAVVLVFATYNLEGYSYFDWALADITAMTPLKLFAGVVLVIGWVIYIRATIRSLGPIGLTLAAAFFGSLIWLIIDVGNIATDNIRIITYLLMVLLCAVLATGISWSHIRRRISGQVDVDDVEE